MRYEEGCIFNAAFFSRKKGNGEFLQNNILGELLLATWPMGGEREAICRQSEKI